MNGRPHASGAEALLALLQTGNLDLVPGWTTTVVDRPEVVAAVAQAYATLALAHEQRLANLIAVANGHRFSGAEGQAARREAVALLWPDGVPVTEE